MNESEFTPGPWQSTESTPAEGYHCWWITANPGNNQEKELATVAGGGSGRANARLIAAAPDQHAIGVWLDKLSLVIESAVRADAPSFRDQVIEMLKANRAAIAKTGVRRPPPDEPRPPAAS